MRPPPLPSIFRRDLRPLAVALAGLLFVAACASESTLVSIGDTDLDRATVLEWIEVRGGVAAVDEVTIEAQLTADVLSELVTYEALVDLLAEHGVVASEADLASSSGKLLVAGFDAASPAMERFSRWQAALDAVEAGVEGARAAYEANVHLFSHELCTSHILVSTEDAAAEVIGLLAAGSDFAELARQVSQDPGSGSQGGGLGCVPVGAFVPTFERATLGAIAAGMSLVGPVPSQFGYHVIRVDEVRPTDAVAFEDLGGRVVDVMLGIATMTREVSLDGRFGSWDPVMGRVSRPAAPSEG